MEKVALVTGSSGFIGSHLSVKLCGQNIKVLGLSRSGVSNNPEYNKLLKEGRIIQYKSDVTDFSIEERPVDYIFHIAGKVAAFGKLKDFKKVNVEGTRRVLEYAKRVRPSCFVYFSSTAVYGYTGYTNLTEDAPKQPFKNPYSITKLETEELVEKECKAAGIDYVVIRPGNAYGEYDYTSSFEIYNRIKKGKMPITAKGKFKSCFVYAGNLADAAILTALNKSAHNTDYNVTDGVGETLREYFGLVAEIFGVKPKFTSIPAFMAKFAAVTVEGIYKFFRIKKVPLITKFSVWQNCSDYHFSIDKLKSIGFKINVPMEEGVKRTVDWINSLKAD